MEQVLWAVAAEATFSLSTAGLCRDDGCIGHAQFQAKMRCELVELSVKLRHYLCDLTAHKHHKSSAHGAWV